MDVVSRPVGIILRGRDVRQTNASRVNHSVAAATDADVRLVRPSPSSSVLTELSEERAWERVAAME